MQRPLLASCTPVKSTMNLEKISNVSADKLFIYFTQTDVTTNYHAKGDLQTSMVNMTLKQGGQNTTLISAGLMPLFYYTDFLGGTGYVMGTTNTSAVFYGYALIPLGRIDLSGGGEIVFSITWSAGTGTGMGTPVVYAYLLDTDKDAGPIRAYEHFSLNGSSTYNNAIEAYTCTAASARSIIINDGSSSQVVNDTVAVDISQAAGKLERAPDTILPKNFGMLWMDQDYTGKDITIKTPAALDILVVRYA